MASEIRVNTINNRSGLGTISITDSGASFSGVVTATGGFSGNLTGNATGLSGSPTLSIGAGSTSAPSLSPSGDSNTGIFFPSADTIAFAEGGVEAARIDSSGRLLVGTNAGRTANSLNASFQLEGTSAATGSASLIRNGGNPYFGLYRTGSTSLGSVTAVPADAGLAEIDFGGADGTNVATGAYIIAVNDAGSDWTTSSHPTRIAVYTAASGSTTPTERMRIGSNGNVTLNGGNLVLSSGAGIDFSATANSSGTMTSELLDDYEEGNVSISATPASGTITINDSGIRYTRIGRLVTLAGFIQLTVNAGASGDVLFGGLPFTVANYTSGFAGGHCAVRTYNGGNPTDSYHCVIIPLSNATQFTMQYVNGSGDAATISTTQLNGISGIGQIYAFNFMYHTS